MLCNNYRKGDITDNCHIVLKRNPLSSAFMASIAQYFFLKIVLKFPISESFWNSLHIRSLNTLLQLWKSMCIIGIQALEKSLPLKIAALKYWQIPHVYIVPIHDNVSLHAQCHMCCVSLCQYMLILFWYVCFQPCLLMICL